MNNNPLVGLIDSGVTSTFILNVKSKRDFYWQENQVQQTNNGAVHLAHGSALAEVIIKQAPNAQLAIAQVFHQRLVTTPEQIVAAIDWLISQKVSVINMSFGLNNDRIILQEACQRALAQGIFLVAASPARGAPVFPSSYHGVLRATGDARCKPEEFSWLNSTQADYGACVKSSLAEVTGASVGAAQMSGHIARYLSDGGEASPVALSKWLNEQAKYWGAEDRFALKRHSISPLNKKMIVPTNTA